MQIRGDFAIVDTLYGDVNFALTLGLIGFLIGLVAVMHPQTTVSVIAILYGLFALVAGIVLVVSGFATRSVAKQLEEAAARSRIIEV